MENSIRGPVFREYLNIHVIEFDEDVCEYYTEMIKWFVATIPCGTCQSNGVKFIEDNDPVFRNKNDFAKYVLKLHNHANKKTGKDERKMEEYLLYLQKKYNVLNMLK